MNREFILSTSITLAFLTLGFLCLHFELVGYGAPFFVFLPFTLGYLFGQSAVKKFSLYGLIFSLIVFLVLLIVGGLEGMVCILLAMPLVIVFVVFGIAVKRWVQKIIQNRNQNNVLKSSMLSFLLFLVLGFLEKEWTKNDQAIVSISSQMILPYSPEQVYDAIKSVDTLIAPKSFLMKLDLPIPLKCILEKEEVGGLRTCYFSGGTITERITELKKAKVLRMEVIDYQLTGRKWLGFKEAIYYFEKIGNHSCKITRITTYTSVLRPRFYWQPLEKIGISQEHKYVFDNLKKDLKKKFVQ